MSLLSLLSSFFVKPKPVLASPRPTSSLTPGVVNPDVTQANIATTIGKKGWTATVRPPKSYTEALKRTQMRERSLPGGLGDYEEDHLIPLELGGHPTDPRNLWPEPWLPISYPGQGAHGKDVVELGLHDRVMAGKVSLARAQLLIASDWTTALAKADGLMAP